MSLARRQWKSPDGVHVMCRHPHRAKPDDCCTAARRRTVAFDDGVTARVNARQQRLRPACPRPAAANRHVAAVADDACGNGRHDLRRSRVKAHHGAVSLVQYPDATLAHIEEAWLRTDLRGGDDAVGTGVDLLD